ncbi:MAG: ABC transporter substrate-binding protein, partial [Eubacteriales bacterium]|nr:ABC transporter substrate-binding protein [Eubacteriales bacterium]
VLASDATYTTESVMQNQALAGLMAIQNQQVFQMPNSLEAWDSPVPSGVLGELFIASILFPNQYSADQFAQDVNAYYREFYDFDASFVG